MKVDCLSALKCWLDAGLSFFYPEVCQFCRDEPAKVADGFVGAICRNNVKYIQPPFCERCGLPFEGALTTAFECSNCRETELHFSSARSAVVASGMVLDLLHRYKYNQALWFEPFFAELLVKAAQPALAKGEWDMIIPVPLHSIKQREREFNQAERLAKPLAAACGIPLQTRVVKRVLPTRTQTRLNRQERAANVRKAFALRDTPNLAGKRIVLVDDVLTTGATTSACARALLKGGAERVCVWTLARAVTFAPGLLQ
ncbi:MAG TPA: ComF family protein [Verrucomicrobiae bacterium]